MFIEGIYCMAENWIERRAQVEKVSREGAPALWLDAVAAIEDCCKSFTAHYPEPLTAETEKKNGHRLIVLVREKELVPYGGGQKITAKAIIDIAFDAAAPRITVTNGETVTSFPISSDEEHSFLLHKEEPLEIDAFTRLVLEGVLFRKSVAVANRKPTQGKSAYTAWS
jgi:hypothetical protein